MNKIDGNESAHEKVVSSVESVDLREKALTLVLGLEFRQQ